MECSTPVYFFSIEDASVVVVRLLPTLAAELVSTVISVLFMALAQMEDEEFVGF